MKHPQLHHGLPSVPVLMHYVGISAAILKTKDYACMQNYYHTKHVKGLLRIKQPELTFPPSLPFNLLRLRSKISPREHKQLKYH